MSEYFAMDGYAVFVWGAYGVTGIALIGLVVWSVLKLRAVDRTTVALDTARKSRRVRPVPHPERDGADTARPAGSVAPHTLRDARS